MSNLSINSEVKSKPISKQVAKGASIAFIGMAISQVTRFISAIVISNFLGAERFGLFELVRSLVALLGTVVMLGLNGGIVKFVAGYDAVADDKKIRGTIRTGLIIPLVVAAFVAVTVVFITPYLASDVFDEPRLRSVLPIFILSLPLYAVMMCTAFTARAFRKIKYEVLIKNIVFPLVTLLFVVLSLVIWGGLEAVAVATVVSYGVAAIFGIALILKLQPQLFRSPATYEIKRLLRFSLPFSMIFLVSRMSVEFERMILGIWSSTEEIGIYSAAARVGTQMSIVLLSLNTITGPLVSAAFSQGDFDSIHKLYKSSARWGLLLVIPAFSLMIIWRFKILALFGPEFTAGSMILVILAASRLFGAANGSNSIVLQMTEKQDLEMINNVIALLVGTGISILLVDRFGALGVAIGGATANVVVNILKTAEVYYFFKIHPFSTSYLKPCIAGVIAYLCSTVVGSMMNFGSMPLLSATISFILVYSVAILLQGLDPDDQMIMNSIKRRLNFA